MILVLALIVSMSACVSKKADTQSTSGIEQVKETPDEAGADSTTAAAPDPLGKYNPVIELTSVKATSTSDWFPEGDDINDNPLTRDLENELGIKVKYLWVADQTQYKNKLNLSIASGDIPDYFSVEGDMFKNLLESGVLADLTDVYEQYASSRLKDEAASFEEGFNSAKQNGKLEAMPLMGFGTIALPIITWVRQDWMDSANLSFPETLDGLVEMAETFMEQHPGSYGFALEKELTVNSLHTSIGFANAYHAYPGTWIKDDSGKIVYGSIQPEMKQYLKLMQELYKKGLIDKEFGVKDVNKVNEDIVSGKVGIEFGPQWLCFWPAPDAVKADSKAIWKPYPVPSSDDKPVMYQGGWPVNGYYVVNKECKYPEAIIKMINNIVKGQYEGPPETSTAAKYPELSWTSAPITFNFPARDYNRHVKMAEAIKTRDTSKLSTEELISYDQAIDWADNRNPDGYGNYFQLSSEGSYSVIKKLVDGNRLLLTQLRGPMPAEYAEKDASLRKLELDTFTKIIMGAATLDEFDKFVENWKALGGDAATEDINKVYNK